MRAVAKWATAKWARVNRIDRLRDIIATVAVKVPCNQVDIVGKAYCRNGKRGRCHPSDIQVYGALTASETTKSFACGFLHLLKIKRIDFKGKNRAVCGSGNFVSPRAKGNIQGLILCFHFSFLPFPAAQRPTGSYICACCQAWRSAIAALISTFRSSAVAREMIGWYELSSIALSHLRYTQPVQTLLSVPLQSTPRHLQSMHILFMVFPFLPVLPLAQRSVFVRYKAG